MKGTSDYPQTNIKKEKVENHQISFLISKERRIDVSYIWPLEGHGNEGFYPLF